MSLQDFQTFMDKEQKDTMGNDERLVSKFMRDFLNDPTREVQEPFFTNNEVSYYKNMSHHGYLT
jgi:phosphatidylinositol phospholipase C, gamma-1